MMRALRCLLLGAFAAGLAAAPAMAQEEVPTPPPQHWNFDGLFGTYDLASAQRGFQVYSEVCSVCHSLEYLHYRDLAGIGLTVGQIKSVAAAVTVPKGLDDDGNVKEGPATPADQFKNPYPLYDPILNVVRTNEKASRAAHNGALPPDLTLIVNGREGHADYVYGILNGYVTPPADFKLQDGMNYNKYFPGHQIAMPQPLHDQQVTYADGTPGTVEQMSHDVVTFLAWAGNPELAERKQMGIRWVLFFVIMTGLTYAVKRTVWADVDH
jgi:ubiquinol-cytochrome c reductase cytochrome c1 subunit